MMAKLLIDFDEWSALVAPHAVLGIADDGETYVDVFGVIDALKAFVNAQGMPVTFRDELAPGPEAADLAWAEYQRQADDEAIAEPHDMDRGPVDETGDGWGEVPPLTDAALQRRSLASDRYVE